MKLEHIMLQFLIAVPFFLLKWYTTQVYLFKWKINTIDKFYVTKDKFISPCIVVGYFSAAQLLLVCNDENNG